MSFLLLFYIPLVFATVDYNREELQKKYPGFGTDWIPMGRNGSEFIIGYFDEPQSRISLTPDPSEVVYFTLYSRANPNGTRVSSIKSLKLDLSKHVKFVTHGWMSSGSADTCIKIKEGFLQKYDCQVFIMDWSAISRNVFYPIPMKATPEIAEVYAKFLRQIVSLGVDPKGIHLVGHSLGAHISGFAARQIKKIGRITGLDPALPGFDIGIVDGGSLRKSDANFVDVIHTCAGFLGMRMSLGHADFYPNGGSPPQPGCGNILEMIEACSHGRSWLFFAESLVSKVPFLGYPCDSFDTFVQKDKCRDVKGIPMGDPCPGSARGNFYLSTYDNEPFALVSYEGFDKVNTNE